MNIKVHKCFYPDISMIIIQKRFYDNLDKAW
jgi:hypothetical protein